MDAKSQIQKLIDDLKAKKYREGEAKGLLSSIQAEQTKALQPVLEKMAEQLGEAAKNAIEKAVANIKVEIPPITIPPVDVRYPEIPAPIVNVQAPNVKVQPSQVQFPEFPKFPDFKFPESMKVMMDGVDNKRPLPVMMMDLQGRPMQFPVGASGGKADFFTIKGFSTSAFSELTNPDGRLKVELPSGSSGLTDTELRASSVPVAQASGAMWSTNVVDAFGSTAVGSVFNADNRLRVSVETGGSGLTDAELRATAVPVAQVSGSAWSVSVTDVFGSTGANVVNPDGRLKVELPTGSSGLTDTELRASSVPVSQVSGAVWSTYIDGTNGDLSVTGSVSVSGFNVSVGATILNGDGDARDSWLVSDITNSVKASLIDSTGVQYSGSNPVPIKLAASDSSNTMNVRVVDSGGVGYDGSNAFPVYVAKIATATTSVNIVDSSGVGYSSSNPIPVVVAANFASSVVSVGATLHGVADIGSAPQKVGGIVMTANPTAEVGGDVSNFRTDDIGRQLTRPLQVRDLIKTAYVSVTGGTETTLLAATAGSYNDLIMVVASNNSDAAVSVDIRAVSAGNIINTLRIPANGTAGWTPPIPWPQDATGNNWTVDGPDETGRTLTFSALFSQEI